MCALFLSDFWGKVWHCLSMRYTNTYVFKYILQINNATFSSFKLLISRRGQIWYMFTYKYYFGWELCWYNYFTMLNEIMMTLERLASNPSRKQMFHQDYIDLRSLIIIFIIERFFKFWHNSSSSLILGMFQNFSII